MCETVKVENYFLNSLLTAWSGNVLTSVRLRRCLYSANIQERLKTLKIRNKGASKCVNS